LLTKWIAPGRTLNIAPPALTLTYVCAALAIGAIANDNPATTTAPHKRAFLLTRDTDAGADR
jgi:hypothetical protein